MGWAKWRLRKRGAIVVIAFHRVLDEGGVRLTHSLRGMFLRRRTFEDLARWVAPRFTMVHPCREIPAEKIGRLRVAFSFDDGWHDNYTTAFPITRALGIPITIFVCPGLVGRNSPFWPERVAASMRAARPGVRQEAIESAVDRMKLATPGARATAIAELHRAGNDPPGCQGSDRTLTWEEIVEMDRQGVMFGAHTQTHQVLSAVPEWTARQEILESQAQLASALNKECALFAYPNGNHSPTTRRMVAEAGFSLAFTIQRGAWTDVSDPLAIPRALLTEDDLVAPGGRFSRVMFEYSAFWKSWRALTASAALP